MSLLAKAQCESDAAWENYCRAPTQTTWDLYVSAKRHENDMAVLESSLERLAELEVSMATKEEEIKRLENSFQ